MRILFIWFVVELVIGNWNDLVEGLDLENIWVKKILVVNWG